MDFFFGLVWGVSVIGLVWLVSSPTTIGFFPPDSKVFGLNLLAHKARQGRAHPKAFGGSEDYGQK